VSCLCECSVVQQRAAESEDLAITHKVGLKLLAAGMLAATILIAPCTPNVAQAQQQTQQKAGTTARPAQQQRAAPQRAAPQRAAPQRAAPQRSAPQRAISQRTAPQRATTQRTAPRIATPRQTTPRTVTQQKVPPRVVRQPGTTTGRKVVSPTASPRVITPRGTRAVTASRLRGVPTRGVRGTVIRGHNYSAWRGGHRVRYGSGWRTFVALSALGAIAIGSSQYYPYAYISAPESYCEGLTEDGCELMWQQVETVEGDVVNQCVAYCPWQ
jgi:hypothetical protein